MRARVAVATALLALAAAPSAHAGQKPNGRELWRAYPPKPEVAAPRAAAEPAPRLATHTAERLRAAVDIRLAREWPWPAGSEGLWRCEIGPDPGALSSHFRAIVHSPDDEPPRVLAVSAAGRP